MNCCDDYGQCTRGPNCPAGPAGMATAGMGRDGIDATPTHPLDRLADSRGEQIACVLILLAMVLITIVLVLGILGYGYARWGADIEAAFWAGADFAWALAARWA